MNLIHAALADRILLRLQMGCMLAMVMLAAGCATLAGTPVDDTALDFELQGRIALRYGTEGGNARITRQRDEVKLVTADGKEHRALDAESLTQSVLGWRLPLAGLPDWVRARPVPGRPAQLRRTEAGQIESVEQDGWLIEYQTWDGALPARIKLSRSGADGIGTAVEIRLVIDKWTLASEAPTAIRPGEGRSP